MGRTHPLRSVAAERGVSLRGPWTDGHGCRLPARAILVFILTLAEDNAGRPDTYQVTGYHQREHQTR